MNLTTCFCLQNYASENGIEIFSPVSHTLFNPAHIIEKVLFLKDLPTHENRLLFFIMNENTLHNEHIQHKWFRLMNRMEENHQ